MIKLNFKIQDLSEILLSGKINTYHRNIFILDINHYDQIDIIYKKDGLMKNNNT